MSSGIDFLLNPIAKLGIFPELPKNFREISRNIFPKNGNSLKIKSLSYG